RPRTGALGAAPRRRGGRHGHRPGHPRQPGDRARHRRGPGGLAPGRHRPHRHRAGPAPATRASLEIERATGGGREGSLLAAIDRPVPAPGARALAAPLARPLTAPEAIDARLDAIEWWLARRAPRQKLRAALKGAGHGPITVAA